VPGFAVCAMAGGAIAQVVQMQVRGGKERRMTGSPNFGGAS